tara:strand:- start:3025 stop:3288 length:264 start_codon:yes stop_codon:yes gene_type:complete
MRVLANGDVKFKPSTLKAVEWMQQDPQPMRSMRKQTPVKIYSGGGWVKAVVVQWNATGITCFVPRNTKGKQTVTVRDNRNIKTEDQK